MKQGAFQDRSATHPVQGSTSWRILLDHAWVHRLAYLPGIGLTIFASLASAWVPRLLGSFTDGLVRGTVDGSRAALFGLAILAAGGLRALAWWLGGRLVLSRGRILTWHLRQRLLAAWTALPLAHFQTRSKGDLLSQAMSDVETVRDLVSLELCATVSALGMLATILVMLVHDGGWGLTLASLGPLLILPFFVRITAPRIKACSRRCQDALGAMTQEATESLGGVRTIRVFGNEPIASERFGSQVAAVADARKGLIRVTALFEATIPFLANLGFVVALGYGGWLAASGRISPGTFMALTLYGAMLRNPLVHLGKVVSLVQRASASLARISELLRSVPEAVPAPDQAPIKHGVIRAEKLSFRYPGTDRNALIGLTFTLEPGRVLAVVGPTGSGKSTLASLLLHLEEPPRGTLQVDGREVLDLEPGILRDAVALAPQDGFLFSGSVLENIAPGEKAPDLRRAEAAARRAELHDTILGLPEGYATPVGENGARLSGGQRQRLSLARMLYRRTPIRILDEALSAVDTATEARILRNLQEDGGPATLMIAHRLSSVRHADEILYLEAGRIVERGTHDELLRLEGRYAQQWHAQAGEPLVPCAWQESAAVSPAQDKAPQETPRPREEASGGLGTLLGLLSGEWPAFAWVLCLVVLAGLVETAQPYLVKRVLDHRIATVHPDPASVLLLAGAYLVLVLLAFALGFAQETALLQAGVRRVRAIRNALFGNLLDLPLAESEQHGTGQLITHLVYDTETLSGFFGQFLSVMLKGSVALGLVLVFMLGLNPPMALATLVLVPLLAVMTVRLRRNLKQVCTEIRQRMGIVVAFLAEAIEGMPLIRAFRLETRIRQRFEVPNTALRDASIQENHTTLLLSTLTEFMGTIAIGALIWGGGRAASRGALTVGVLCAFAGYIRRFFQSVTSITQQVGSLQGTLVAAGHVASILGRPPSPELSTGAAPEGQGAITLEGVSFGYRPGRDVLQEVSLAIPAGSRVGFVGATGAGKTTLLSLVTRLHDARAGRVCLDGQDVREWPKQALRAAFGVVLQDVVLFSGSVMENVRLFRPGISEGRVREVCRWVGAEPFILGLPQGYGTALGQRGISLSAGERQLLSLARALVSDPRVLILDEATASLDSQSEALVQDAVERVSAGRTVLVIAHRLSSVQGLDRIVVLDNGRIAETGTHKELVALGGHYHRLCAAAV